MSYRRILVRATNWVGDAVMSLPALRALRESHPNAEISILAKPWVADLYHREPFCDRMIPYTPRTLAEKWSAGRALAKEKFDCAILLQNAFEAALVAYAAGIPDRIGYARDGRSFLLTRAIPVPRPGEIPPHERFYYLELLRRAGFIETLPESPAIRLEAASAARESGKARLMAEGFSRGVIGMSPGAAYGTAKQWIPERFAAAATEIARATGAGVAIFGSKSERELCESIAALIRPAATNAASANVFASVLPGSGGGRHNHGAAPSVFVHNYAGETTLGEFIDMAAACRVYLTNDSGGMHIASALGVPTVAIFGATNDVTTGPTGPLARVVREPVECSPCLKRECPIDHRCMTRVNSERVARIALDLMGPISK